MAGAPGPWAGGYVFPDPTQGTPAPAPDQTPAPTGAGPTPQPPTVPAPQAGPAPTLGDVQQAAQGDEGGGVDVAARFNQYRQLMQLANADAYRPHLDESTKPGLLANVLTFGMAGLMDRDYRMAYNAAIDRGNAKQHAQDTKDALEMVGKDVSLANGNISQQMRMLQLQLQMQNAEYLQHHRQVTEDLSRQRVAQGEQGLGLRQTYPPPTPEQRAAAQDAGFDYVPSPDFPNKFVLVRRDPGAKPPGAAPSTGPPSGGPPAPEGAPPAATTRTPTTGGPPTTVATRLNNPGNINASPSTRTFPGVVGEETIGSHTFLKFDSPESGFAGMEQLLQSPGYRNLPFESGMRRWTTGTTTPTFDQNGRPVGYDLPAMERRLGIAPNTRIGDLTDTQRRALVREMANREGYQGAPAGGGQPAAAAPSPAPAEERAPPSPTTGTTTGGVKWRVPGAGGGGGTAGTVPNAADPNAPGITPSEKLRRQKLAEKTAAQPVGAFTQKQVASIDKSLAAMDELEKLVNDPEVQPYLGPLRGRAAELTYNAGKELNPKVSRYIQLANLLQLEATGPLLNGSRNPKIWEKIQRHLPGPADEPKLALSKLRDARDLYRQNRELELRAGTITRGTAGAGE